LIGQDGHAQRSKRQHKLRGHHNLLTTVTVRDISGRQEQHDDGNHLCQANAPKNECGMSSVVQLPTNGHRHHLPTKHREKHADEQEAEIPKTQRMIGIMDKACFSKGWSAH
jgi:hypothetical protein